MLTGKPQYFEFVGGCKHLQVLGVDGRFVSQANRLMMGYGQRFVPKQVILMESVILSQEVSELPPGKHTIREGVDYIRVVDRYYFTAIKNERSEVVWNGYVEEHLWNDWMNVSE